MATAMGIRALELMLYVFVPGELIEASDDEVFLERVIAAIRSLKLIISQDIEGQVESPVQLALPLLGEAARTDDEAALEISACY